MEDCASVCLDDPRMFLSHKCGPPFVPTSIMSGGQSCDGLDCPFPQFFTRFSAL